MARKRRKKRSRYRGKSFQKEATGLMIGGAAYGYIFEGMGANALTDATAKVPTIVNRDITNGLILYFANKHLVKNKYVKGMALAALVTGAAKIGQAKFSLSGDGSMYDEMMAGEMGFGDAIDVTEEGEALSGIEDMDEI